MIEPDTTTDDAPLLPMAALVDMVFLMIFYFLVCGSLQPEQPGLAVALAAAAPAGAAPAKGTTAVEVRADGHLIVRGVDCGAGREAVARVAALLREAGPVGSVRVVPADAAPHGAVTAAVEAVTRAGSSPELR